MPFEPLATMNLPHPMHSMPRTPRATLGAGLLLLAAAGWIATQPAQHSALLLAAAAAGFLALIHPWLVWLGLALALPVAAGIRLAGVSPADLLLVTAVALWAARGVTRRSLTLHPVLPLRAVALYLFVLLLSAVGAPDLAEALIEVIKWVEFGLILLVLPLALPARQVPWLIGALLAAAALQGLHGLYQFIFRIGPDWFLIQDRFMRASGVFGQPNPFAAYLGLSWPVALSLSLWACERLFRRTPLSWRQALVLPLPLIASACIAVGLIASWSRGGWIAVLASTLVVFALYGRLTRRLLMAGGLLAGIGVSLGAANPAWIPDAILARVSDLPSYVGANDILNQPVTDENFAVIERLAHWVAALRMWENALWLGVGPGNYAAAYGEVALPNWPDPLGHAHNIYLNVLGETGLIGGAAFLLLWGSLVGWLLRALCRRTAGSPAPFARMARKVPPTPAPNLAAHQNCVMIGCYFDADAASQGDSWIMALGVGVAGVLTHLAIHSLFDNLFVQGMYLHIALWLAAFATAATGRQAATVQGNGRQANPSAYVRRDV